MFTIERETCKLRGRGKKQNSGHINAQSRPNCRLLRLKTRRLAQMKKNQKLKSATINKSI